MGTHTDELTATAAAFKALSDPTRLRILLFLRACHSDVAVEESGDVRMVSGPTVGAVCCHITGVDGANPTISHHLKELRNAGLITMERQGQRLLCSVRGEAIAVLEAFLKGLQEDCDGG